MKRRRFLMVSGRRSPHLFLIIMYITTKNDENCLIGQVFCPYFA
jgi:hypothetical protein